ncbi:MAG: FecR domain-containing protein [Pseudomonadota bacterium]
MTEPGDAHRDAAPPEALVEAALQVLIATQGLAPTQRLQQLYDWRCQSPNHAAALREAEATWKLLGRVPDEPLGTLGRARLATEAALASVRDYPVRVAVGMCLVAGLVLIPLLSDVDSRAGLTVDLYERYLTYGNVAVERMTTAHREQREVALPGGATLWLNWNSEVLIGQLDDVVHVDVRLGDALFSIPKTQRLAVVVHAGEALVHPEPGEFAVHSHSPRDAVFQVRHGSIRVTGARERAPQRVGAAQQTFLLAGKAHKIARVDVASIAAWQKGKLVFDERSLTVVLHALSHYTDRKLSVGAIAEDLAGVSAVYPIDRAESVLLELAAAYDLELVEPSEDEWLVQSAGLREF